METSVYEIKQNNRWIKVRATSMLALDNFCKLNRISKWRMVGMMSISETAKSQNLKVIA